MRVFLPSNIEPFQNLSDTQLRILNEICKCYYNFSLFFSAIRPPLGKQFDIPPFLDPPL